MNLTQNAIAQLKAIRAQGDSQQTQINALIDMLGSTAPLPEENGRPPRATAGNQCPNCGVSNPTRETSGGFGSGEEKTYCGSCSHEF